MKICIIIPAYNEEKRIGKTLEEYSNFFRGIEKNTDCQILVVINGTTDNTENVVKNLAGQNKKISYLNFKRGGKGFAITEGFKDSLKRKFDLIGFVDADMATSPKEYYKLIKNIWDCDGVIADRYMKGSKIVPAFSFRRLVVSRVFNFIVRGLFLFPYRDTQTGAKIFKREVIEKIVKEPALTEWAYDVGLLYSCKKKGFRIKSVPTEWIEKEGGTLKIGRVSMQMLFSVVQLRILKTRFSIFLRPLRSLIGTFYHIIKNMT